VSARAVGFAAMTLLVCALLAEPASATYRWTSLEYSPDGRHWSADMPGSLLGDEVVLGPGGSAQRTFWVADRGGDPAHLALTVRTTGRGAGAFDLQVRTASGPWARVRPAGGALATDLDLEAATTEPVTLRVSLPATADHTTMHRRLHLDVELAPTNESER
jgi:hypothetical protein